MSCKKPILLAIDGVSRELVETANCGLFVDPENSADFADKINIYLNNPKLVFDHGINGFNYVIKNFDRQKLAKEYINSLSELVDKEMKDVL